MQLSGNMKRLISHIGLSLSILLAVVIWVVIWVTPSMAQQTGPEEAGTSKIVPSRAELQLLGRINQARKNPLQAAANLGLDPQAVLEQWPELKGVLVNGLPPLQFNENLYTAAMMHSEDMTAQKYYSGISPDGRTVRERMAESGYLPSAAGESLGMLAFINFLPSETAVQVIFENMLKDELNPDTKIQRNILNPAFKDVGVYLGTGSWILGSKRYNVYLSTCDFGNEGLNYSERVLIALINQARANPIKTAASIGMDMEKLFENRPDLFAVLNRGLPPVSFNHQLYKASRNHLLDMLKNDYFSHVSPDGKTAAERLADQGYEAIMQDESLGSLLTGSIGNHLIAFKTLFENKFKEEFTYESTDQLVMLNPEYNEIGVGFDSKIVHPTENSPEKNHYLMVLELAKSEFKKPNVFGVIYSDVDLDGMYDPGEGIGRIKVRVMDESGKKVIREVSTDISGSFTTEIAPGCYNAKVVYGERTYGKAFVINSAGSGYIEIKVEN